MVDAALNPPPVLQALDALISLDQSLPGFTGTIAIGVQARPAAAQWWSARFTDRARATFTATPPDETDVAILLEADDGARILRGEPPRAGAAVIGDAQLWHQFHQRYLGRRGFVSVRLEQNQQAGASGPFGRKAGGRR